LTDINANSFTRTFRTLGNAYYLLYAVIGEYLDSRNNIAVIFMSGNSRLT